jgi:hypothetical protein
MLFLKLFVRLCEFFDRPDDLNRRLDEARKQHGQPPGVPDQKDGS